MQLRKLKLLMILRAAITMEMTRLAYRRKYRGGKTSSKKMKNNRFSNIIKIGL